MKNRILSLLSTVGHRSVLQKSEWKNSLHSPSIVVPPSDAVDRLVFETDIGLNTTPMTIKKPRNLFPKKPPKPKAAISGVPVFKPYQPAQPPRFIPYKPAKIVMGS